MTTLVIVLIAITAIMAQITAWRNVLEIEKLRGIFRGCVKDWADTNSRINELDKTIEGMEQ